MTFDFEIASCGCEGCLNQGAVALANTTPTQCFYDDLPGCVGAAGASQHSFPAPSEPGTYFFHFTRMWNFSCAEVQNQPIGGAPRFAAICVAP